MKTFLVTTIICIFLSACYKDHSNSGNLPKEEITVKGIEALYNKTSFLDSFDINPQVSSSSPDAAFEYFWGIYDVPDKDPWNARFDTIAYTRQLKCQVNVRAGKWQLVFCARNTKTGYASFTTASLVVYTRFTRGWYVVKDNGADTDLDLFMTPAAATPTGKIENVINLVNHKQLKGAAGSLTLLTSYKSTATGTNSNTRALFVWSGEDMMALDLNTCSIIRSYDSLFYSAPPERKPVSLLRAWSDYYMINNGRLYSINNTLANTGQFGNAFLRDNDNSVYHLSKYYIASVIILPLLFDETSSSFVSATGSGAILTKLSDAAGSQMPSADNNKSLLYLGLKNSMSFQGWAIFQDKTDPALKLLTSVKTDPAMTLFLRNDTLAPSSPLYAATTYTLLYGDENLLYCVNANKVWSRNLSNKTERLQYAAPKGEVITFIRHRKYEGKNEAETPYYYNYVIIGTKSGNKYKIRLFNKKNGNMDAVPAVILEGTGSASDILYIAPDVTETSYASGY
jgi:hypothetical protein